MDTAVDKTYQSGHPVIDFQHRLKFKMIVKLNSSLKTGKSKEVLEEATKFFECYIIEHFSDEEDLQKESGYPNYEAHKRQHDEIREDFLHMKGKIDERGANHLLAVELMTLISEWMNKHFKETDKEFIGHLKEFIKKHQKRKIVDSQK